MPSTRTNPETTEGRVCGEDKIKSVKKNLKCDHRTAGVSFAANRYNLSLCIVCVYQLGSWQYKFQLNSFCSISTVFGIVQSTADLCVPRSIAHSIQISAGMLRGIGLNINHSI